MKLLRAAAALVALGSAVLAHGAPAPKTVTTGKLTMTGIGDKSPSTAPAVSRPFAPKTLTTGKLTMTGIGDKSALRAPAISTPFTPKTLTTGKLTMTGVGK